MSQTPGGELQSHSAVTCLSNLPDHLTEDNDNCRLTTGTSISEITKTGNDQETIAHSPVVPDSDCDAITRISNLPVQSSVDASTSQTPDQSSTVLEKECENLAQSSS